MGLSVETRPEMVWMARPVTGRPWLGGSVLVLIAGVSAGVGVWMKSPYWSIFAFLVLFLSLESFFFATTYRLGEDGVEVKKRFSRSFRGWDAFRTIYVDRRGVTLSPYGGRSFMEPFRALRLHFGDNREPVLDFIRSHTGADARIVEMR